MGRKRSGNRKNLNNRVKQSKRDKAKLIEEDITKQPHCLVLTRGSVSPDLKGLSSDFQRIMEPNIPARLQSTKNNTIKDFVAVSAQLGLTHIVSFTQTELGMYMRLCRLPQGPTVCFKIENYTRAKDVLSSLRKQYSHGELFMYSPCIMTNIQPNEGDLQLQVTARMLLDMFPTISPEKATPEKIRRCCLVHYEEEEDAFELRHYSIRTVPVEVSKGVKKLLGRKIPDLGKFGDVSEYITKAGALSDSEAEDDPDARVNVSQKKSRGVSLKSSVRLHELGPRLTMKIYKVEAGLLGGKVLYHSFMSKTDEEKTSLEQKLRNKKGLREKRKKEQARNVEEKKRKKEEHKKKCLEGMGIYDKNAKKEDDKDASNDDADDEDDDAEYYRDAVGEEPDPDVLSRKRKNTERTSGPKKKFKISLNKERGPKENKGKAKGSRNSGGFIDKPNRNGMKRKNRRK